MGPQRSQAIFYLKCLLFSFEIYSTLFTVRCTMEIDLLKTIEANYKKGLDILNDDDPLNDVQIIPLQLMINNEINRLHAEKKINIFQRKKLLKKYQIK